MIDCSEVCHLLTEYTSLHINFSFSGLIGIWSFIVALEELVKIQIPSKLRKRVIDDREFAS